LVAYLASPAGDFFSGSVLTLDGARDNHTGPWPAAGSADAAGNPLTEARRTRDPTASAPRLTQRQ
jgi:citronellol/citronellal dehydrogenase